MKNALIIATMLAISSTAAAADPGDETCSTVAKLTMIVCAEGYTMAGASQDDTNAEFTYGQAVCVQAGKIAYAECRSEALEKYNGKTGYGMCADLGMYYRNTIQASCIRVLSDEKAAEGVSTQFTVDCLNKWATQGQLTSLRIV